MTHPRFLPAVMLTMAAAAAMAWAGQARAGDGLYRCVVDGIPTFTDKFMKGKQCRELDPPPPPPSQPYIPVIGPSIVGEVAEGQKGARTAEAAADIRQSLPGEIAPSATPRGAPLPPLPPQALPGTP